MLCRISAKRYQRDIRKQEIKRIYQLLQTLIPIVERKSNTSRIEIERLAHLIKRLTLYFPDTVVADWEIYLLAHLLFVSRIKIPDYIYTKKDRVSSFELLAIKEHVVFADEILNQDAIFNNVREAFTYHHDRIDGKDNPPFLARTIHVAESYISMISPRSYRNAYTPMEALAELQKESGTMYDPLVIEALKKEIGSIPADHTYHTSINLEEDCVI